MMYGTVSLLDNRHTRMVEDLWDEFKAKLGVHGVHRTPVAHFSYHVAEHYDLDKLREVLLPIVQDMKPFRARTNGLGIFTGEVPVLYVLVNPDLALVHFQQHLWNTISASQAVTNSQQHYHPDRWQPHITLTHRDVDHSMLPEVIRLLSMRQFNWEIEIDNLALLNGSDDVHSLEYQIKFGT